MTIPWVLVHYNTVIGNCFEHKCCIWGKGKANSKIDILKNDGVIYDQDPFIVVEIDKTVILI